MALLTGRWSERAWLRLLASGLMVGTVVLGVGGRAAMAMIQAASNTTPPRFTLGGSMTVIGLGAANGLLGAGIALVFRTLARRLDASVIWGHAAFGAALALLTSRGLRGTDPIGNWYFYPLVGVYGVLTIWLDRRWTASKDAAAATSAAGAG